MAAVSFSNGLLFVRCLSVGLATIQLPRPMAAATGLDNVVAFSRITAALSRICVCPDLIGAPRGRFSAGFSQSCRRNVALKSVSLPVFRVAKALTVCPNFSSPSPGSGDSGNAVVGVGAGAGTVVYVEICNCLAQWENAAQLILNDLRFQADLKSAWTRSHRPSFSLLDSSLLILVGQPAEPERERGQGQGHERESLLSCVFLSCWNQWVPFVEPFLPSGRGKSEAQKHKFVLLFPTPSSSAHCSCGC